MNKSRLFLRLIRHSASSFSSCSGFLNKVVVPLYNDLNHPPAACCLLPERGKWEKFQTRKVVALHNNNFNINARLWLAAGLAGFAGGCDENKNVGQLFLTLQKHFGTFVLN